MLKELYIHDFILIEKIRLIFGENLNIISGETGTGKSLIIGAFNLILGQRVNRDYIRKGKDKAIIQGIFSLSGQDAVCGLLESMDIDHEGELSIRRIIRRNNTGRCYVNDTVVTLGFVREIGNLLVDLHGQHQHQSLLNKQSQLNFYDIYSRLDEKATEVKKLFIQFKNLKKTLAAKLAELEEEKKEYDLYTYQIREIEDLELQENEYEELVARQKMIQNHEKLTKAISAISGQMKYNNSSVLGNLDSVVGELESIKDVDKDLDKFLEQVIDLEENLRTWFDELQYYRESLDYDEYAADEIRQRMDEINKISMKYRCRPYEIPEYYEKILKSVKEFDSRQDEVEEITGNLNRTRVQLIEAALELSKERKAKADEFCSLITAELQQLGMENASFSTSFSNVEENSHEISYKDEIYYLNESGIDRMTYTIRTNLGEDFKPLNKIASGGELSRVMLALKKILADAVKVPILVFDEIDSGIGGKVAKMVGEKIWDIARQKQVICITHLPQIASKSDTHFTVVKKSEAEQTITYIEKLDENEKSAELARMIAGDQDSEIALTLAREMQNQ